MNSKRDIPTFKIITLGGSNVGKSSILLKYIKNEFSENMANTVGIDNINKVVNIKECGNGNGGCAEDLTDMPIHLQIWDTAGQERFNSIVKSYYRGADAFLFVYDVTDHRTLEYVENRISELMREKVSIRHAVIIGNKADLITAKRQRKEEILIRNIAVKLNRMFLEREVEDKEVQVSKKTVVEPFELSRNESATSLTNIMCDGELINIQNKEIWDYCLTSALTGQNIIEMFDKLSKCLYGIDKETPENVIIKKKRKCKFC